MNKQTTHVTLTIPKHIRRKMLEFQKKRKVNWSRVARLAFIKHMEKYSVEEEET